MNTAVEKRRAFITNFLFFSVIFALVYLFIRYAFRITFPFLAALAVAAALQKPLDFITGHTPLKRGSATVILQLLVVMAILGPIALIVIRLFSEFSGFLTYLKIKTEDIPAFLNEIREFITAHLPQSLKTPVNSSIEKFFSNLQHNFSDSSATIGESSSAAFSSAFNFSSLASPVKGVISVARQLPTYILSVIVAFIAGCFITIDYKNLKEFVVRQLSPSKRVTAFKAKKTVKMCLSKMGKAYAMLMTITFFEMFFAFNLFKIFKVYEGSYIFVLSIIIAVVDILPVLGTGTVLVPWAVYSIIVGNYKLGIALLILYGLVTVLRQIIEPKLVSGQLGLPPFITITAMFFGAKLFGFIGLFLLPLTIIVLKILNDEGTIHLWIPAEKPAEPIPESSEKVKNNK